MRVQAAKWPSEVRKLHQEVRKLHQIESTHGFVLHPADIVLSSMCVLAALCLLLLGRSASGWWRSALVFGGLAGGPLLFRTLAWWWPRQKAFDWVASFWLIPSAALGHGALGPLVDALRPGLVDKYLALLDLRLFGFHPSLYLSQHVGGAAMDVLLVCYYTYFLWPVLLGLALYRRDVGIAQTYILSLTLCFSLNFICYVLFPAIGPRYFLTWVFHQPLHGAILTPYLESLMRSPAFARDCFPSGHTAGTLVVLIFAFRHARKFFWFMLPFATGLIAATLAGRFHYGVDLLCAVPLALAVVSVSTALYRARPAGLAFPARVAPLGQTVRA